jgi:hypothetical protein
MLYNLISDANANETMLQHDIYHIKVYQICPLEVIAIILLLRQQSSVPAASKVLLQPTVGLGVSILCNSKSQHISRRKELRNVGSVQLTLTTNEAQRHRQENKRMQRRPNNKRQPHPEIVNLENLAPRKRQNENAQQLRDSDTRKHRGADIDESSPGASRATSASELAVCAL